MVIPGTHPSGLKAAGSKAFRAVMALATLALGSVSIPCPASETGALPLLICDGAALARMKAAAAAGDAVFAPALGRLLTDADADLGKGPWSVMDKTGLPPSGDKHDYYSLAPYFWPDPSRPGGLPYLRNDGKRNPDYLSGTYDKKGFEQMRLCVEDLGLAYYLTGREAYAAHAALLLKTWFLDPATRMNPNFNDGQSVPGGDAGRPEAVLDAANLPNMVEGALMLQGSPSWTPRDAAALRAWFLEYLEWLLSNPLAVSEFHFPNNHGSWYDSQAMALALYVGRRDLALKLVEDVRGRIDAQIAADGTQPLELTRTRSWHYSLYNLQALFNCASLADKLGVDLWSYRSPRGRSLGLALDAMAPYADTAKPWPYREIGGRDWDIFALLLQMGIVHIGHPGYAAALKELPVDSFTYPTRSLLKHPELYLYR